MSAITDARFAARAAGIASYSLWCYVRFETEVRLLHPEESKDEHWMERHISSTMHRYGRMMTELYGLDIATEGLPADGFFRGADAEGRGRVFVSNHRSALDILATLKHFEGKHVSRADLAGWPIIGLVARRIRILFVDRENRRSAAAVMKQMIDYVERGIGVIIFPEGTTFDGDEVRPFKPGAFTVARKTGCEIVPFGIAYASGGASFGDESMLLHMRRVSGAPKTRLAISVGEPFRAGARDTAALAIDARESVQGLVHRARKLVDP
ncbi:MAG: lysophospholipid acyltransferase family protein [Polyangiaceae bacterium]